ncbi:uncharacterized protein A4U43_C05F19730 [Asparagus officinalis]|uniref:Uncharacterized protein n=1 Tax=Asparagus officinalis TaxID=4686 RepID=A0A5P1EVE4_ASPOF|nr:uncharacterized protein A4U43_C05F19730 [Asparagus officinalis]
MHSVIDWAKCHRLTILDSSVTVSSSNKHMSLPPASARSHRCGPINRRRRRRTSISNHQLVLPLSIQVVFIVDSGRYQLLSSIQVVVTIIAIRSAVIVAIQLSVSGLHLIPGHQQLIRRVLSRRRSPLDFSPNLCSISARSISSITSEKSHLICSSSSPLVSSRVELRLQLQSPLLLSLDLSSISSDLRSISSQPPSRPWPFLRSRAGETKFLGLA